MLGYAPQKGFVLIPAGLINVGPSATCLGPPDRGGTRVGAVATVDQSKDRECRIDRYQVVSIERVDDHFVARIVDNGIHFEHG